MAMNFLMCYVQELGKPSIRNCSTEHNSTSFKECLATFDDDNFDDFMVFFGQIRYICDYLTTPSPTIEDAVNGILSVI